MASRASQTSAARSNKVQDSAFAELFRRSLSACFTASFVCLNPLAWLSQAATRFTTTRLYVRWYVANHITWTRHGPRLKVSRFFYEQRGLPTDALVRPWLRLDTWNAFADGALVPYTVYTCLKASRKQEAREDRAKADAHMATALCTPLWWALRWVGGAYPDAYACARPVRRMFGQSKLERRAAGLVQDRTADACRSFDGFCDVQSVLGLGLRAAVARAMYWMGSSCAQVDSGQVVSCVVVGCVPTALVAAAAVVAATVNAFARLVPALFGALWIAS